MRIVAGFGRSGTTWIQDALAQANSLRAVFEPLHPAVFELAARYAHTYRDDADAEDELYDFLYRFAHEDFHSLWADYRVRRDLIAPRLADLASTSELRRKYNRNRNALANYIRYRGQRRNPCRILKLIHANMMLPWLQAKLGAKIVFVIRHPIPVILSQMRNPAIWHAKNRISQYRKDNALKRQLTKTASALLFTELEDVEALALSWCIENSIALEHCRQYNITTIFYERLIDDGEPGWQRIIDSLQLPCVPDKATIARPSQQTWGKKATDEHVVARYAAWQEDVAPDISVRIQAILDKCEIDIYSSGTADPLQTNVTTAREATKT